MIYGEFNSQGELIFEIGLISADGDIIPVQALLDTGFTGWLAIENQDAFSLGWLKESHQRRVWGVGGRVWGNPIDESSVLNLDTLLLLATLLATFFASPRLKSGACTQNGVWDKSLSLH
jgi:hypothetical protein